MSSHSYEVALFGEFFSQDLKPILNRITLHSDSSQQIHTREIVFEPVDANLQRDGAVLLRAKKELSQPNSTWFSSPFRYLHLTVLFIGNLRELFSYLKPESVRVHPEATVRPWSTCEVIGDALSFAAALGYV